MKNNPPISCWIILTSAPRAEKDDVLANLEQPHRWFLKSLKLSQNKRQHEILEIQNKYPSGILK